MLPPGLYEQVINTALNRELSAIPAARKSVAPIDKAEASKVLAQYLADVVQKGLENVVDNGGDISTQISLANQIVTLIQNTTQEADFAALSVDQRAEQLLALLREQDPRLAVGKTAADLSRPETSIAQSSLFTGAIHEPQMYTELKKEIVSAELSEEQNDNMLDGILNNLPPSPLPKGPEKKELDRVKEPPAHKRSREREEH